MSEVGRPDSETCYRADLGLAVKRAPRTTCRDGSTSGDVSEVPGKFEIIELSVLSRKEVAKKLYAKFGFMKFGMIPRAVKREKAYFNEDLMRLDLGLQ